ncbi:Endoribonuclease YbeY [bioreactor metagenome]|uniref:Endoribonuclease YbeY n=1 Tax=bioreactor metagenome TaxID=1076179 RepID=A0A645D7B2_9ZZZZ
MSDAARLAGLKTDSDWEFRVWFLDDRAMAQAHVDTMNVAGTTDVITLAYLEEPEALFPGDMGLELLIGVEVAAREGAARADSSFADELMLYLVHGCLHAAGENDLTERDRARMRRREAEVLGVLRQTCDFNRIFPVRP